MPIDRDDTPPPEPHHGMTPEEKGELLLRYIKAGRPVVGLAFAGTQLEGKHLHKAKLKRALLTRSNLRGAHLKRAYMLEAIADAANFQAANLRAVCLRRATIDAACLDDALMEGADLAGVAARGATFRRARLSDANFEGACLHGANLSGAVLDGANLRSTDLGDALLEGTVLRFAKVDESTYRASGWTPEFLQEVRARGAEIVNLHKFPPAAQRLVSASSPGLTLTFDTRLHRFDATAFDALIAEVLGPDTDVTIEERSNIDVDGPAFIRINGSRPEDLVAAAEAFYDRVWRGAADADDRALQRTLSALEVLFGLRLDRMRDDLSAVMANTALLGDEDVREAITDKATEHIEAKRKKEFSTRTQRLITAVASEARKRTLDVLVGEGVAAEAIEIAREVAGDSRQAIEDARAARFERKLIGSNHEEGS